jgi:carbon storage regulator
VSAIGAGDATSFAASGCGGTGVRGLGAAWQLHLAKNRVKPQGLCWQRFFVCRKDDAMLVLARKAEQRIQIGNDITITVLRIRNGAVKIGIQAPSGVPVYRTEILKRRAESQDRSDGSPANGASSGGSPRGQGQGQGDVVSTAACDEDAELSQPEGGPAMILAPRILLTQRLRDGRSRLAALRSAGMAVAARDALPAVTAEGSGGRADRCDRSNRPGRRRESAASSLRHGSCRRTFDTAGM